MPFWSTNFGEENADYKDPKRKFRFTVEFQGLNADPGGAALWYAKTVTKPSFTINTAEHKYLNHTFFYPGSVTWQDVSLTLVDPVSPDMTATFSDILELSGYKPPTDASSDSMGTMSKAKSASALGTVLISQIDADGNQIEQWTLWNAFVSEVKYGDLAYGEDDLIEMSVTMKYDWARVTTTNPSAAAGGGTEFFNV